MWNIKKGQSDKSVLNVDHKVLPLFINHQDEYLLLNYNNTQDARSPADIVYVINERDYFLMGRKINQLGYPYKLRLSNEPIGSSSLNGLQGVYWTLYGLDNLLTEPFSKAILILKVAFCHVVLQEQGRIAVNDLQRN